MTTPALQKPARSVPKPPKGKRQPVYTPRFLEFWEAWVGPGSKIDTLEAWNERGLEDNDELRAKMWAGFRAQVADRQRANGGFYAEWKHAQRWVRGGHWDDKLVYSKVVDIQQAPKDGRAKFLEHAHAVVQNQANDGAKLAFFVDRAERTEGVTIDLEAAVAVLNFDGLDEALIWVQKQVQAGKAPRREATNG